MQRFMGSTSTPQMVTVLLVDDDPMTLAALRRLMLSEGGYRVEVALNAEQALEKLETGTIQTVVADFNLAGPDGGWLLRKVRTVYPGVRRVLLSGSNYTNLSPHLEPGLADVFISKPIEPEELFEALA